MNVKSNATEFVWRFSNDMLIETSDQLAIEEPLEIQLKYFDAGIVACKTISVTMRTPGNDEELAAGFLFTEGIIKSNEEIESISVIDDNRIIVSLHENVKPFLQNADRNFYTTSSCGVCGKTSIDAVKTVSVYKNEADNICIDAAMICQFPEIVKEHQPIFEATGGLHASALFDFGGKIILLREDVGRHNALDKLIGTFLRAGSLPLHRLVLLLSGRASFELIQKANMAGVKIVLAIGAPSSLAVQFAKETGITLIGFLRNKNFNIYSGEKRIKIYEPQGA